MEYLFLQEEQVTGTSRQQKAQIFRAMERQWMEASAAHGASVRKVDYPIYMGLMYQLKIRRVFLDDSLSLKKFSALLGTNQTYLSNVVNTYCGCNLRQLVNTCRVEYAKELIRGRQCPLKDVPRRCGFASRSPFYSAFSKQVGMSPLRYSEQLCEE